MFVKNKHCQIRFFLYRVDSLAGMVAVTDVIHLDLRRGAGVAVKGSELNSHKNR